jgi:hypothetical protein
MGHDVLYGDIADAELLAAARAERASLAVVTVDSHAVALRTLAAMRQHCPQVPVIARARDLEASSALVEAGAIHAYPETIESSLRLGATALRILQIPTADIDQMLQGHTRLGLPGRDRAPCEEGCPLKGTLPILVATDPLRTARRCARLLPSCLAAATTSRLRSLHAAQLNAIARDVGGRCVRGAGA